MPVLAASWSVVRAINWLVDKAAICAVVRPEISVPKPLTNCNVLMAEIAWVLKPANCALVSTRMLAVGSAAASCDSKPDICLVLKSET
jgi:hypothetical protein